MDVFTNRQGFAGKRNLLQIAILSLLLLLAGCSGIGTTDPTTRTEVTETLTTISEADSLSPTDHVGTQKTPNTQATTEKEEKTESPTRTEPGNWSQIRKYRNFGQTYNRSTNDSLRAKGFSIQNDTLEFAYEMANPNNASEKRAETRRVLLTYWATAKLYLNESNGLGKGWIPKRLEVTALHPDSGEVYWRGHTNYTIMNEYRTGERPYPGYVFPYYNSLEWGPAHPEYEGQ